MDEFLKNIYGNNNNNNNPNSSSTHQRLIHGDNRVIVSPPPTSNEMWRETEMTLEEFLTKARTNNGRAIGGSEDVRLNNRSPVPPPMPQQQLMALPAGHQGRSFEVTSTGLMISGSRGGQYNRHHGHGQFGADGFGNGGVGMGRAKRRVVVIEESVMDKATQQKQRRMIKNRESAARSRERKQARTTELESLVARLQVENAHLVKEEAQLKRERLKKIIENVIPVVEKRRPRRALRRVMSSGW